jgi:hypothetical protein
MAKPPVPFELVSMQHVPVKPPIMDQPVTRSGSQWDQALTALGQNQGMAIRIKEEDGRKRGTLKSTLTIMAHNRSMEIEVRDDGREYVYAFLKQQGGRYYDPT